MTISQINKVVAIGTTDAGTTFCKIVYKYSKLSITGVEGPRPNGDCRGSCGQIVMSEWEFSRFYEGWNAGKVAKFRAIWNKWHLNDMRAGSPDQEAYLEANPVTAVYPESHYDKACKALEAVGLNPDPGYLRDEKPYKYGSAWLKESVPEDVLEWLDALPETTITPAWV